MRFSSLCPCSCCLIVQYYAPAVVAKPFQPNSGYSLLCDYGAAAARMAQPPGFHCIMANDDEEPCRGEHSFRFVELSRTYRYISTGSAFPLDFLKLVVVDIQGRCINCDLANECETEMMDYLTKSLVLPFMWSPSMRLSLTHTRVQSSH